MVGKATERAVLIIDGEKFEDWETVMVRHEMNGAPPFHCRFTCSEGMPLVKNFATMRIRPGQHCEVTLAGLPAFSGKVEVRQVYYDAHRHHIEIQCATHVDVVKTSVVSKTMEWKGKRFDQIASELLGRLGINLVFEGGPPPALTFPRASATHGESIFDFLDTLARGLAARGMPLSFTSNPQGDFVVIVGPGQGTDHLVEGVNILVGREAIFNPAMAGNVAAISQSPGDDKVWGAGAAHVQYLNEQMQSPFAPIGTTTIVAEMPSLAGQQQYLGGRLANESLWNAGDQVTVWATVYGWIRPTGGLWQRNQKVVVTSPMLIMDGEPLTVRSATFTQDDRQGTRTTLELVNVAAAGRQIPALR